MKFETDDYIVEFEDSPELRDKVFEAVLSFYKKHESFCGEVIMQADDPIIEAPEVLSRIADNIIKFKVTCKE